MRTVGNDSIRRAASAWSSDAATCVRPPMCWCQCAGSVASAAPDAAGCVALRWRPIAVELSRRGHCSPKVFCHCCCCCCYCCYCCCCSATIVAPFRVPRSHCVAPWPTWAAVWKCWACPDHANCIFALQREKQMKRNQNKNVNDKRKT